MKLIKTRLQNGLTLWYRADDKFIGQRIALAKYEEYESILILRNVNKSSVVIDVGANIGYYTLLLATVCKKVYAFEPDKTCFEILEKNIRENNLNNVVLFNSAVGDKNEKVGIILDDNNFGNSRVGKGKNVDCIRLDDVIKEKVDLIKIDTQGWEPKVILGAKKIIKKYKPILFLEFNGDYKMINFLKKHYKNIFTIDYWFYILRSGIKIDNKTGYADLVLGIKHNIFEQYRGLQWKKVIKKIFKVK
ncbi:MAG: FkbM family methyltransferase [Candidatus Shapirobacteria bacterium]